MKIKIPKELMIWDDRVKVKQVKNLWTEAGKSIGRCDVTLKEILLEADLEPGEKEATFMHELVEYCLIRLDVRVTRNRQDPLFVLTHHEVDQLSRMLKQALETAKY